MRSLVSAFRFPHLLGSPDFSASARLNPSQL
jgi:hypothetical protein